jgi:hypothetical protein
MHPSAVSGTFVQIPPKAPSKETMERGTESTIQPHKASAPNDLLDGGVVTTNNDVTNSLHDFFDNVSITGSSTNNHNDANIFDTYVPGQSTQPAGNVFSPTIAQIPAQSLPQGNTNINHVLSGHGPPNQQVVTVASQGVFSPPAQGYLGHVHQNANVNANLQQHSQAGVHLLHPTPQGMISSHRSPNYGQTLAGPPQQPFTMHQPPGIAGERTPALNINQFDPFAKR